MKENRTETGVPVEKGGAVRKRGRPAVDIAGQRSGKVVALERSEQVRRGVHLWLCRCDCGKEFYTEAYRIRNGSLQSCGCSRNAHKRKDLAGQRFGKLIAVRRLDEKRGRNASYLWLCRCDCGREIKASTDNLLKGS